MGAAARLQGRRIAAGLSWRQLVELEACARCGACRGWCPVYAEDAREAICARGKLAALRSLTRGVLPAGEHAGFVEALYECSACGQCHVVCPVRIDTPELWEQARLALGRAGFRRPEGQTRQMRAIKESGNAFGRAQAERGDWAAAAWRAGLLREPVRLWRERPARVLYFAGCTASFDGPMRLVAAQSARLLQEAGVDFAVLGPEEPCCASKLRRMGDEDFAAEAARRAALLFGLGGATFVASCAGCYKGLRGDYARLPPAMPPVLHLTQLLARLLAAGRLHPRREVPLRVTYHDPCHLGRHGQLYGEPRRVLAAIPGLQVTEMPRHGAYAACCGMGGGLKLANEGLQRRMAAARVREAERTGAEAIVTPCQTCCAGLRNGVREAGSALRVLHLNDVLAAAVCPEATPEQAGAVFAAGS